MDIHAKSGIPRLLFDAKTDKSMEAKFGDSTMDVFLVQDSTHSWIMIEADISFENLDYELMFILMFIHTTYNSENTILRIQFWE
jgi:hypothetical protein